MVFTIYDLSLIRYHRTHPKERVWFFKHMGKNRLHLVDHVLTISDYIKRDIYDTLDITSSYVSRVHLAPADHFYPRSMRCVEGLKETYAIKGEYFLFVGSLEPRKNLPLLIQALQISTTAPQLVIVGWEGWGKKEWKETVHQNGLDRRITLTGYVDDETLAILYSGATALVYPSLYEGFGLPILEAMACGCPVICSNVSSMPEVAGKAAIFISPFSAEELASAIDRLQSDRAIRQGLIDKGYSRAMQFTWRKTAENTFKLFKAVASEKPSQ
jgi:alpha-1,3-rhamnosyl/mannosyltransferase